MFQYLDWIERTALSVWIREGSLWAFPNILILHTVGLAFLVGANVAIDARLLGVAARVPLSTMLPFYRVMWAGFWVNAISGVLLLWSYPTKSLTNPLFYVKLGLIAIGLVHAQSVRRTLGADPAYAADGSARLAAAAALCCWVAAITAGRFLAYTYNFLLAYEPR